MNKPFIVSAVRPSISVVVSPNVRDVVPSVISAEEIVEEFAVKFKGLN